MEFTTRNVNTAIAEVLWKLKARGRLESSRNGPVLVFPEPVTTTYLRPLERVLFWEERDANPVFHLMEAIWMMAGRRDVAFPEMFNSRFGQYSDDGVTFNAAYGYRWRHHFGYDQLARVVDVLKTDPNTRQAVVQIWDTGDLGKVTRDKACNMQVIFEIRSGLLNMTVINRSNDIWYGAYGSNPVHFSILMEFVASAVGVPVGVYRQYSHNLHLYTELYDAVKYVESPPSASTFDYYGSGLKPYPLLKNLTPEEWLAEAETFCEDPYNYEGPSGTFFTDVARPVAMVSRMRKSKTGSGMSWANEIAAEDWRVAVQEWVLRREEAKK